MKKLLFSFLLIFVFVFALNSNAQEINPNPVYSSQGIMDITLNGAGIKYIIMNDDNSLGFFTFDIGPFTYSSLYIRDVSIAPSVGFFVIDGLRIGASLGFSFDYISFPESTADEGESAYMVSFPASIQADYHLMINETNFVYFGLTVGGGIMYSKDDDEDEGTTIDFINIGPRAGWKWASNSTIIDLGFNYTFQSMGDLDQDDEDRAENHIIGLYLNIGGWFNLM